MNSVCSYEWCWICDAVYTKSHFAYGFPLGCKGLQKRVNKNKNVPRWKKYLRKASWILLLPLYFVFGIPGIFCRDWLKTEWKDDPIGAIGMVIPIFLIGLVLSAILICFLPLIGTIYLANYCCSSLIFRLRARKKLGERERKASNGK